FLISDFITEENYEKSLKVAAKKHDLTGICIYDKREKQLPNIGVVQVRDEESGKVLLVNTASKKTQRNYARYFNEKDQLFKERFQRSGAGVIQCSVEGSYVRKILNYFKSR